jgi:single-strand DNA-binding protein
MKNSMRNKVLLIGNLGGDPEVRELNNGRKMGQIRVATNERYKDASGEYKDDVQWHSVVAWGPIADRAARTLQKGSSLVLDGRLVHRNYETKEGEKRYITEVWMHDFHVVGPKREAA